MENTLIRIFFFKLFKNINESEGKQGCSHRDGTSWPRDKINLKLLAELHRRYKSIQFLVKSFFDSILSYFIKSPTYFCRKLCDREWATYTENAWRRPNADLTLVQRRRRWTSVKPALGHCTRSLTSQVARAVQCAKGWKEQSSASSSLWTALRGPGYKRGEEMSFLQNLSDSFSRSAALRWAR